MNQNSNHKNLLYGDIQAYFTLKICFHFKLGAVRKATPRLQRVV